MDEDNDFLNEIDKGYIGYTKPEINFIPMSPVEALQAIQGDWPMKDYMEDGSDSGMNNGDLKEEL